MRLSCLVAAPFFLCGAFGASLHSATCALQSPSAPVVARLCRLRGGGANVEHTYAMIKPDVTSNDEAVAAIKAQIEAAGLTVEREERCKLSRRQYA